MYYDTVQAQAKLPAYEDKAARQDARILSWFVNHVIDDELQGASSIWQTVFQPGENVPITSVRRALNTLASQGHIKKTKDQLPGVYGRPECGWIKTKPDKRQAKLF